MHRRPLAPEAAILIAAAQDQYVSADSAACIHRLWVGSTMWQIAGGHVSSFVLASPVYKDAIREALTKLEV